MKKNKHKNHFLKWLIPLSVIITAFAVSLAVDLLSNAVADDITIEEAQGIIDDCIDSLPQKNSSAAIYIADNTGITVNSLSYGLNKNVILDCDFTTVDVYGTVSENSNSLLCSVYDYYLQNEREGKKTNATKVMLYIGDDIEALMNSAGKISGNVEIQLFQTKDGYKVYLDDATVNTVFGGLLDAKKLISETTQISYNGETVSILANNTLRNGFSDCISFVNYSSDIPDSTSFYIRSWNKFKKTFILNFGGGNWKYLTKGLLTTMEITLISLCIGILIGAVAAIVRCTYDKTGKLEILNAIFKAYITVIRGTPVMIQLLIIYFVILLPIGVPKFPSAVLCFGINSGSYVAEILRGGLMSVDEGQNEAGRSLGFNYVQTMIHIIIPQAFKAVLPSLANEFISLLKETSVAFYIGVADLTQGGLKIRSITYSNFMPLLAVALIYFVIVYILTKLVSLLEKRLRKSER